MLLKLGVVFEPEKSLLEALSLTEAIFKKNGYDLIITSMKDREHRRGSLHYIGEAFDCRIRHLQRKHVDIVLHELVEALKPRYNVSDAATHIHIEVNQDEKSL